MLQDIMCYGCNIKVASARECLFVTHQLTYWTYLVIVASGTILQCLESRAIESLNTITVWQYTTRVQMSEQGHYVCVAGRSALEWARINAHKTGCLIAQQFQLLTIVSGTNIIEQWVIGNHKISGPACTHNSEI